MSHSIARKRIHNLETAPSPMRPDLILTRYKADWQYIIQRFAGGTYTLQAIEHQGKELDGIPPRRFVNLGVYHTETDADDMMMNLIRCNPAGTFDQAVPYWTEWEPEPTANGDNPIVTTEKIRALQREYRQNAE